MRGTISSNKLLKAISEWIEPVYGYVEAYSIARIILEKLTGYDFHDIHINKDVVFTEKNISLVNSIIQRLLKNEPIQYIMGEAFFYDRWFNVNPSVLIPRSETEELCRLIINENTRPGLRVLDIGTGCGCIAVILGLNLNSPEITGLDNNPETLKTAESNALKFNIKINFYIKDIFHLNVSLQPFDIIVSNPPYVRLSESKNMARNVLDYEPAYAIFTEEDDPLIYYKKILSLKNELLLPGGRVYFEINESFAYEIEMLFRMHAFNNIRIIKDINGKDRIASAQNE